MTPDLPDGYRFIYTVAERRQEVGDTRLPRVIVSVGGYPHGIVGSAWQEVGPDLNIHALEQEAYDDAQCRIYVEAQEAERRAEEWT